MALAQALDVHRVLARRYGEWTAWALLAPALFASGFALSIGRILTWNSWDVLTEPRALAKSVLGHVWEPQAVVFTVGFGVLLTLGHAFGRELGATPHDGRG